MKHILIALLFLLMSSISCADGFDEGVIKGEISQEFLDSVTEMIVNRHKLMREVIDAVPLRVRDFVRYYLKTSSLRPNVNFDEIYIKEIENIKLGPKSKAPWAYRSGKTLMEYWVREPANQPQGPEYYVKKIPDGKGKLMVRKLEPDMVVAMGIPIDCKKMNIVFQRLRKRIRVVLLEFGWGFRLWAIESLV